MGLRFICSVCKCQSILIICLLYIQFCELLLSGFPQIYRYFSPTLRNFMLILSDSTTCGNIHDPICLCHDAWMNIEFLSLSRTHTEIWPWIQCILLLLYWNNSSINWSFRMKTFDLQFIELYKEFLYEFIEYIVAFTH